MADDSPLNAARRTQLRELFLILAPAVAVAAIAVWITWQFVQPAPPGRIVIATGGKSGAYYGYAKQYAALLAEKGILLDIRESKGSIDNFGRLRDPASDVDVAFMQGGILTQVNEGKPPLTGLQSLGRLFLEPMWVFSRAPGGVERLGDLAGKTLAVGGNGSGTAALVTAVLAAHGVTPETATFLPIGNDDALAALKSGKADVAFFVVAPEAPIVGKLLADPDLILMHQSQAEALSRRFPYLQKITLPRGAIDLAADRPDRDIALVAPVAALVAHDTLHPALAAALAETTLTVHARAGLFNSAAAFPSVVDPELPVADEAVRVHRSGTPFLQRYMPFWVANLVERALLLLLPLLTLIVPLSNILPRLYRWRVRSRVFYWYGHLRKAEQLIGKVPTPANVQAAMREIEEIDAAVAAIPVPLGFSDEVYNLRSAVDLVRSRIDAMVRNNPALLAPQPHAENKGVTGALGLSTGG